MNKFLLGQQTEMNKLFFFKRNLQKSEVVMYLKKKLNTNIYVVYILIKLQSFL